MTFTVVPPSECEVGERSCDGEAAGPQPVGAARCPRPPVSGPAAPRRGRTWGGPRGPSDRLPRCLRGAAGGHAVVAGPAPPCPGSAPGRGHRSWAVSGDPPRAPRPRLPPVLTALVGTPEHRCPSGLSSGRAACRPCVAGPGHRAAWCWPGRRAPLGRSPPGPPARRARRGAVDPWCRAGGHGGHAPACGLGTACPRPACECPASASPAPSARPRRRPCPRP